MYMNIEGRGVHKMTTLRDAEKKVFFIGPATKRGGE